MTARFTLLLPLLLLGIRPCYALEAIELHVDSVQAQALHLVAAGVDARLLFPDRQRSALTLNARRIATAATAVRALSLRCSRLIVHEPQFACETATIQVDTGLGTLGFNADTRFDSARGRLAGTVSGLSLAGGQWALGGDWAAPLWHVHATGTGLALSELARTLKPWWALPAGWTVQGDGTVTLDATGRDTAVDQARAEVQLTAINAQNAASTYATDKLAVNLDISAALRGRTVSAHVDAHGSAGQLLAGPALLDFTQHPLRISTDIQWSGNTLQFSHLLAGAPGLLQLHGQASLDRTTSSANTAYVWQVQDADITVDKLSFPAAYTSFMQLPLATTNFGALAATGAVQAHLVWRAGQPQQLDVSLDTLGFDDPARNFHLANVSGQLHWRPADTAALADSHLSWQEFRAYGLEGGAATVNVRLSADDFRLTRAARIPLFDGALSVQHFEMRHLAGDTRELDFDATIEPISMTQISRAFGWPEMEGTLSGRIPGLTYRDHVLSVAGQIDAKVFNGSISASNLRLMNPLGQWPQLSGNFIARRLDLAQITRTFPIGSITGLVDADIQHLELFNWSPIAFDARLYTSPGDRSRHRISQKAVSSLSNIGGGGGVSAALQTGFLKFFKSFGYDRIGLSCQLRNDVCLMGGIPKAGGGFYIVKGGGLPRLDIVANSGRVAWSQLIGQIGTAIHNSGDVVVN